MHLQKETGSGYCWRQNGTFFEWSRSEFYELSYWIRLLSKVLKYPRGYHYVVKSGQYFISHMQYNHLYGYYSFLHLHLKKLQVDGHKKLQFDGPKVTSL